MNSETRKVRFLIDSKDEDLGVDVCVKDEIIEVSIVEEGIMFFKWCEMNKEEMGYLLPHYEENRIFEYV